MSHAFLCLTNVGLTLAGNAGPVEVLNEIDLVIGEGATVGLVGPSGSGKSSMLMLLGGLERATEGMVEVMGKNLGDMNEDELAAFRRQNVGVVFQSFHLIPTMTALENVATPLELAGCRDAFDLAESELREVGLDSRIHHFPFQMSGGEQQRVAIARASAPRPRLLLADEPTGNLDSATGDAIMDLLFGLNSRHGSTLILATHDHALADRCRLIVGLHDGTLSGTIPATSPEPGRHGLS
ncbi:MAG: ATP-binding cassette domain-containing protein [Rhodobacteraceae bacterium]|nr:ATP-binding cassette domain-containing protein [Paracoccaceae bacterium]MCY4137160.1 ATP-binding cassette domain-containing protein [Paracoccaceae bacterium]